MFPACSVLNSMAYPKSGTGDSKPLVGHETQDPGFIIQVRPGTVEVRPNTRDPRPISWVGPGTRDPWSLRWDPTPKIRGPCCTRDPRPEARDTERETWYTYDRWNPKLTSLVEPLDTRTMIYVNLIKCPINGICVMIFLILNHILKWLQHL